MEILKEVYEQGGNVLGKTEFIRRLKKHPNYEKYMLQFVDRFFIDNQQQTINNRFSNKYPPLPISDKSETWMLDLMFPFGRSQNKILIMTHLKSRYVIAKRINAQIGEKADDPNDGPFGQIELNDADVQKLLPTLEKIIKDLGEDRITKIIADAEFNTNKLNEMFDKYNLKRAFINSRDAHQFKGHNPLGPIDNAIKNFRLIMNRMKANLNLTDAEVMNRIKDIQNIMNQSVNRGIELKNTTPEEAFMDKVVLEQIRELKEEKHQDVKKVWEKLNKERDIDEDKPYLLKVKPETIDKDKQRFKLYYDKPFFVKKVNNSYITDVVGNVFLGPEYYSKLDAVGDSIFKDKWIDEFGNFLTRFKPYELVEYKGDYDEEDIRNQDPIISRLARGRKLTKKSFIEDLEDRYNKLNKPKQGRGRPKKS